ncbi:hypothetical protein [Serratia fonticola]|uniref:hypothetical protein n=1 Tax=Serratia fonticola TaxID=47917 RepID=UPI001FD7306C|nr:hypothetical protein [Serratia fonticola]CAI0755141.1 Uncharacterised protein [Serratia fonticola]
MKTIINLSPGLFGMEPNEVYRGAGFTVTAFMFPGDIAALVLQNQRGTLTLLPYQDLMIWDAVFDGQSLKAKASQLQPRRNDARGCFASHQGLPANHGPVIDVWLEVEEEAIAIRARTADGPCRIQPAVQLAANSTQFSIEMVIDNLAEQAQPLNYMCHMNYACEEGAVFRQNLPGCALNIRDNPQQVICSDDLSLYVDQAEFFMLAPCGRRYVTRFATGQFSYAVLRRPRANSRATAFVQPASCSPESTATPMAVMLKAGEMREFRVMTGIL